MTKSITRQIFLISKLESGLDENTSKFGLSDPSVGAQGNTISVLLSK